MTPDYSFIDAEMPDPTEESVDETAGDVDGTRTDLDDTDADADYGGLTRGGSGPADGVEPDFDAERDGERDLVEEGPLEREAMFIGLGDAVIPTVLVASAAFFAPESVSTVFGIPLPALTAMVGTFAGLSVLLWMVLKGRAHAGLPLLNGGTIAGYVLGALASGLTLVQALGVDVYF